MACSQLPALPSLAHGRVGEEHVWRFATNGSSTIVKHRPRLAVDDFSTLIDAVRAGMGIAAVPYVTVADELASGALVELLTETPLENDLVHAVFPTRRGMLPAVRHLLDYLAADSEVFARMQQRNVPSGEHGLD